MRRKTHKEFTREVFDLVGDEYTVVGKYERTDVKLKIEHKTCGNVYDVMPSKFLQGRRCPRCQDRSWSHEYFVSVVHEKHGNNIEVVGKYKRQGDRVKVKCNGCSGVYMAYPTNLVRGGGCYDCAMKKVHKKNTKTQDVFIKEVRKQVNDEYKVLGEYVGAHDKIPMLHKDCGYKWEVTPVNFLQGVRCPVCSRKNDGIRRRRLPKSFSEIVKRLGNKEYTLLSNYETLADKVLLRHDVCGKEIEMYPGNFLRGNRCKFCFYEKLSETRRMTNDEFLGRLFRVHGDEYEPLEIYAGIFDKIKTKHKVCGYEFSPRPSDLLDGTGCPKCASSKGERRIMEYLDENLFKFAREYTFKDCKNKRPLPFDFAVFDGDGIQCLIEYEGEQHFRPVEYWGGEEAFNKQLKRDKIKSDYCVANDIKLIEIPYWDFENIENILSESLKNPSVAVTT